MDQKFQSIESVFIFINVFLIVFSSSAEIGGIMEILKITAIPNLNPSINPEMPNNQTLFYLWKSEYYILSFTHYQRNKPDGQI